MHHTSENIAKQNRSLNALSKALWPERPARQALRTMPEQQPHNARTTAAQQPHNDSARTVLHSLPYRSPKETQVIHDEREIYIERERKREGEREGGMERGGGGVGKRPRTMCTILRTMVFLPSVGHGLSIMIGKRPHTMWGRGPAQSAQYSAQ